MIPKTLQKFGACTVQKEKYNTFNIQCQGALIISLRVYKHKSNVKESFDFLGSSAVNACYPVDQMCHCAGVHGDVGVQEERVSLKEHIQGAYIRINVLQASKEERCGMKGSLAPNMVEQTVDTLLRVLPAFSCLEPGS